MASVKKGNLTATGKWWRHLRRMKRAFWKGERQAQDKALRRVDPVEASLRSQTARPVDSR